MFTPPLAGLLANDSSPGKYLPLNALTFKLTPQNRKPNVANKVMPFYRYFLDRQKCENS
jgi:hypothetical protein